MKTGPWMLVPSGWARDTSRDRDVTGSEAGPIRVGHLEATGWARPREKKPNEEACRVGKGCQTSKERLTGFEKLIRPKRTSEGWNFEW